MSNEKAKTVGPASAADAGYEPERYPPVPGGIYRMDYVPEGTDAAVEVEDIGTFWLGEHPFAGEWVITMRSDDEEAAGVYGYGDTAEEAYAEMLEMEAKHAEWKRRRTGS